MAPRVFRWKMTPTLDILFAKPKSGVVGVPGGGVSTVGHSFKNEIVESSCDHAV